LSSPSRFRSSPSSPVNTSNLFKVEQGQAVSPVPLLARCAKSRDLRYRVAADRDDHRLSRHYRYFPEACALPPFLTRACPRMPAPVSAGSGGAS
jgi:hypothetical protein